MGTPLDPSQIPNLELTPQLATPEFTPRPITTTVQKREIQSDWELIEPDLYRIGSSFKKRARTYYIVGDSATQLTTSTLEQFLENRIFPKIKKLIFQEVSRLRSINVTIIVDLVLFNPASNEAIFHSLVGKRHRIYRGDSDLDQVCSTMIAEFQGRYEEVLLKGSGLTLGTVYGAKISLSAYIPVKVGGDGGSNTTDSCDFTHNMLRLAWATKINFQYLFLPPTGNFTCFKDCVNEYTRLNGLNFDFSKIHFPTPIDQLKDFEVENRVCICVYEFDSKSQYFLPFRIPPTVIKSGQLHTKIIHLLLVEHKFPIKKKRDNKSGNQLLPEIVDSVFHYLLILDLAALVKNQKTLKHEKIRVCPKCLHHVSANDNFGFQAHLEDCELENFTALIKMPDRTNYIKKFTNHGASLPVTFTVYLDFEASLRPVAGTVNPKFRAYQKHEMLSWAMYVVFTPSEPEEDVKGKHPWLYEHPLIGKPIVYVGTNGALELVDRIMQLALFVERVLNLHFPIAARVKIVPSLLTGCPVCQKEFTRTRYPVQDHSHLTGLNRECFPPIICVECNLQLRVQNSIVFFTHNGSRYDNKYILQCLKHVRGRTHLLASSSETQIAIYHYLSDVKIGKRPLTLVFFDSYRHLPLGLRDLSLLLPQDKFLALRKAFPEEVKFQLVTSKLFFCYDYITGPEVLEQTTFPEKVAFFNRLTEEAISDEDYAKTKRIYEVFECKNLGDFLGLYVTIDCLILADVHTNFRRQMLEEPSFRLDPGHFCSLPSFSFNLLLKFTQVEYELLRDGSLYLRFLRGLRGGFTTKIHSHIKAVLGPETENDEFLDSDKGKPENLYLMNYDVSALYPFAASSSLCVGEYSLIPGPEVDLEEILNLSDDSPFGFALLVDVHFPRSIHDYLCDYPPLPEKLKLHGSPVPRLISHLSDRVRYLVHYRLLQFVTKELKLKIVKVHSAVKYRQRRWVAGFMQHLYDLRTGSKDQFESTIYKLISNSSLGASIKNVLKQKNISLVYTWDQAHRLMSKPNFEYFKQIDQDRLMIFSRKRIVNFNQLIVFGQSYLDESKKHVLFLYYKVLKQLFDPEIYRNPCIAPRPPGLGNLTMVYSDTDSFIVLIRHRHHPNKVIQESAVAHWFDFSNFPSTHPFYNDCEKGRFGVLKDEAKGRDCGEFIGIGPKTYFLQLIGETDKSIVKAKGVPHADKKLLKEQYLKTLYGDVNVTCEYNSIRSRNLSLFSVAENKIALRNCDVKRIKFGNYSLPFGHYLSVIEKRRDMDDCEKLLARLAPKRIRKHGHVHKVIT